MVLKFSFTWSFSVPVSDSRRGDYKTEEHEVQPTQERSYFITTDVLVNKGFNVPKEYCEVGMFDTILYIVCSLIWTPEM